ncbi:Luc7-like protein 3 [Apophysomyces ossiformis]|uniref:Luc7-like protein 3 n=1 Tax=Apophysomyces ossiformis TaxID=679940 RepID=A0A8H7BW96_9FUNG|nr:Luc7-like protein 3 [Apophysomyces ossiformis]
MSQYVDVDNKDFWDESVCKHYLVSFCPSQLFTNTKSDLGPCDKIHNDRLKERYQNAPDKNKYPFEADFYDYLNKLIMDLARRIRQGKGRLNIQCDDKSAEARKEEREEKMVLLDVKIKELLQKSEEAGEEGRVQEATELTGQVEKLQEELEHLRNNEDDSIKLEKRMEVCQVCGAFLVTNDSSDRLEAHYQGKQHQGYLKIRDTLEQMKEKVMIGSGAYCRSSKHDLWVVTETFLVQDMTTAVTVETEVGIEITVVIQIAIAEASEKETAVVAAVTDVVMTMIGTVKLKSTAEGPVASTMTCEEGPDPGPQEPDMTEGPVFYQKITGLIYIYPGA